MIKQLRPVGAKDYFLRNRFWSWFSLKVIRLIPLLNQITATPVGKQTIDSTGPDGRFPTLKEAERLHIEEALLRAGGNQGTAATLPGISRPALNRRLARMKGN